MQRTDQLFTSKDQHESGASEVRGSIPDLVSLFERSAALYGDRPMFGVKTPHGWRWITYREIGNGVARLRAALKRLGVGKGDRVAIISRNSVEWVVCAYATYGLGAMFVPMYESQRPEDWEFIIRDSGAVVLFIADHEIAERVRAFRAEIDTLRHAVIMESARNVLYTDCDYYRDLIEDTELVMSPSVRPEPDDIACLIYTSGTTGKPKGVMLSHRNVCSNISSVREQFPLSEEDRSLSFLPWAHSFGHTCELHGLISIGASIGICEGVEKIVDNLAEVRPTIFYAVPNVFNKIYIGVQKQIQNRSPVVQMLFRWGLGAALKSQSGKALGVLSLLAFLLADRLIFSKIRAKFGGRLRFAISGGAALSKEVAEFIDCMGISVFEGYGLSETSPIVSTNSPVSKKMGTVGKPIAGVRVEIDVSTEGSGTEGEVVIYGPNVMKGYHNRPDENSAAFTEDGGLKTGDLGFVDKDGFLHITGRIKEQYKLLNGKYVVPSPLEEDLKLSPLIANVFIYGDNRPFNVALIVPDTGVLGKWAKETGGDVLNDAELAQNGKIRAMFMEEVGRYSRGFRGFERIMKILIITEDFTQENGMLTPTLKLKRRKVMGKYGELIESLYS